MRPIKIPGDYSAFRPDNCFCRTPQPLYDCNCKDKRWSFERLKIYNRLKMERSFIYKWIAAMYENCAAFNLRYCPIGGHADFGNYGSKTLKDILLLFCFLVANTVVLFTILFRIVVHMYYTVVQLSKWIRGTKKKEPKPVFGGSPGVLVVNPPLGKYSLWRTDYLYGKSGGRNGLPIENSISEHIDEANDKLKTIK